MNFSEMNVRPEIVKALFEMQIEQPTSIQEQVLPQALEGKDIVGISKTGSGKTLAFGIPLLSRVTPGKGIQALVLAPTRELAEQICTVLGKTARYVGLKIYAVYGGVSMNPQIESFRRADVIVGTPGRVLDHLQQGTLRLDNVHTVVLDEADKMASMGFVEDVERIVGYTPKDRQTFLFGATLSDEVERLKRNHMINPITIKTEMQVDKEFLDQFYYETDDREKFSMLVHLIRKESPSLAIVFCATRRNTDLITKNLNRQNVPAEAIHGGLSQPRRLRVIGQFHKGKPSILVATEVAARGLDIKNLSHIFNYDVPRNPEDYIHRIGRTARAGESGKALTILSPRDHEFFRAILGRYPVDVERVEAGPIERVPFDAGRRSFGSQDGFRGRGNFSRPSGNRYGGPRNNGPRNWGRREGQGESRQGGYQRQNWNTTFG